MQTRIVALEGEVQKSRAQFQELEGSVTALASHLQVLVWSSLKQASHTFLYRANCALSLFQTILL